MELSCLQCSSCSRGVGAAVPARERPGCPTRGQPAQASVGVRAAARRAVAAVLGRAAALPPSRACGSTGRLGAGGEGLRPGGQRAAAREPPWAVTARYRYLCQLGRSVARRAVRCPGEGSSLAKSKSGLGLRRLRPRGHLASERSPGV